MKKIYSLLTAVACSLTTFAGNFNFPQNVDYDYGTVVTNRNTSKIQSYYESWKSNFYTESGNSARIKFDEPDNTVSEGIGYGMLIFVYMENETNKTQSCFDKLWQYYKDHENNNGLMNWKIQGFTNNAVGSNGATDGDLDVALALLLAHKQWGSDGSVNYIAEAETLMDAIYTHETNNNFFKPGDAWQDKANPCYFTIAAVGLFDQVQTSEGFKKTHPWSSVYSTSLKYLKNSQSSAGLWPDWTSFSVDNPSSLGNYYWDACRTPWRVAWDYLWYGTQDSKDLCANVISFMNKKNLLNNPASVHSGYDMSGNNYNSDGDGNACFYGGFAAALMTDDAYQSNLDTYYSRLCSNKETYGYYAPTLQVLYMLTLSGNTPNFYASGDVISVPRLSSASNDPTDGRKIVLSFSKKMSSVSTSKSIFSVKVNGKSSTISSITTSGSDIILTLSSATESGDEITVSYNSSIVTSADGGILAAFNNVSVKNNLNVGLVLADCESSDIEWFTFNDNGNGGKSTVDPLTDAKTPMKMTAGGAAGTDYAAMCKIQINRGSLTYNGFAGMGFEITNGSDLANATGISFWHKGTSCMLEIQTSDITNDQNFMCAVDAHTTWTKVELSWEGTSTKGVAGDFKQDDWGKDSKYVTFSPAKIVKVQWKKQSANTSSLEELWVDEIQALGISGTVKPTPSVDKEDLSDLIKSATTAKNSATIGNRPGQYPQSAVTALNSAISVAQSVYDNKSATSSEVSSAVTKLESAIETFENSKIAELNTSKLTSVISKAKTAFAKSKNNTGTDPGNYGVSETAALNVAISTSESLLETAISQSTIDNQVTALQNAINDFNASLVGPADNSELLETISSANELLNQAQYKITDDQYWGWTQKTYDKFAEFVEDAKSVANNSSSSQKELDAANATLLDKISWFKSSEKNGVVNKDKLTVLISTATNAKNSAIIGTTAGTYPQSAVTALNSAISVAQKVADNKSATAEDVALAESDLQTAIRTFEASMNAEVDKSELNTLIVTAETHAKLAQPGIYVGTYPQSAIDALQLAINEAKIVVNNVSSSESEIISAVNDLQLAVDTFLDAANTAKPDAITELNKFDVKTDNAENLTIISGKQITKIEFVNVLGSVLKAEKVNATEVNCSISEFADGIYIAIVHFADGSVKTIKNIKR